MAFAGDCETLLPSIICVPQTMRGCVRAGVWWAGLRRACALGQHVDLCLARLSNGWPSGNVSQLLGAVGPPSCTLVRGREHCDVCTKRKEQPRLFGRGNSWAVDSGAQSLQTLVYRVVRTSRASFTPLYERASIKKVSLYLLRVTNLLFYVLRNPVGNTCSYRIF